MLLRLYHYLADIPQNMIGQIKEYLMARCMTRKPVGWDCKSLVKQRMVSRHHIRIVHWTFICEAPFASAGPWSCLWDGCPCWASIWFTALLKKLKSDPSSSSLHSRVFTLFTFVGGETAAPPPISRPLQQRTSATPTNWYSGRLHSLASLSDGQRAMTEEEGKDAEDGKCAAAAAARSVAHCPWRFSELNNAWPEKLRMHIFYMGCEEYQNINGNPGINIHFLHCISWPWFVYWKKMISLCGKYPFLFLWSFLT